MMMGRHTPTPVRASLPTVSTGCMWPMYTRSTRLYSMLTIWEVMVERPGKTALSHAPAAQVHISTAHVLPPSFNRTSALVKNLFQQFLKSLRLRLCQTGKQRVQAGTLELLPLPGQGAPASVSARWITRRSALSG